MKSSQRVCYSTQQQQQQQQHSSNNNNNNKSKKHITTIEGQKMNARKNDEEAKRNVNLKMKDVRKSDSLVFKHKK
jgi:hypothetical protein